MPDTLTSADVRQRLGDAAAKLADLRSRPFDQRGDTYAADLAAADTVLDLDGQLRTAQAMGAYDLQAAAWDAAVAQEERRGGPNPRPRRRVRAAHPRRPLRLPSSSSPTTPTPSGPPVPAAARPAPCPVQIDRRSCSRPAAQHPER